MSFLAALLCCSASDLNEDSQYRSRNNSNKSKRLTPSQSNIQKSLAASISERPNNSSPNLGSTQKQQQQQQQQHLKTSKQQASDAGTTQNAGVNQQESKPSSTEITAVKDSSDSSKDTQSITVHDEMTINEGSDNRYTAQSTFNDESTGNVADNEQDDEYDVPETELNSISSSSSEEYERGEELDLTAFQPGQSCSSSGWLLETATGELAKRKCLVLDLDETLVHSSFKYVRQADFVIPVEIEGQVHNVYVIKRPGVDEFLKKVSQWYEVVVFTASVSRYGDPLLDILDKERTIHHRLFRDSCYNYQGNYIKNLSQMGRELKNLIIIDNSPASYIFHPQHAVPISSWFSDTHDCELLDILPLLKDLSGIDDIRLSLDINI